MPSTASRLDRREQASNPSGSTRPVMPLASRIGFSQLRPCHVIDGKMQGGCGAVLQVWCLPRGICVRFSQMKHWFCFLSTQNVYSVFGTDTSPNLADFGVLRASMRLNSSVTGGERRN